MNEAVVAYLITTGIVVILLLAFIGSIWKLFRVCF